MAYYGIMLIHLNGLLIASLICFTFGLFCIVVVIAARRRIRSMGELLKEKEKIIEQNARLLIEKNIEMVDEHLVEQRLTESQNDFIGIISHQLQTPITEITWGLGSLFEPAGEYHAPERLFMEKLYASAEQTEHLVDMLLRFISAEKVSGVIPSPSYSPDDTVREAAERTAKRFSEKHIELTIDLQFRDTISSINRNSLDMITANLIENAFYYTGGGGHVTVASAKQRDASLKVSVQDTGTGIPKERQPYIFSRYNRTHEDVAAHLNGTGLGLYIVRQVLERYGGIVDFETEEGKGSLFYFIIPAELKK